MSKKSWNKIILELLSTRPIAFNPVLARITNSATAGLFMSQLLFWWDKGHHDGWIYKTIDDVRGETGLKRSEQDTAIMKWEKLGVLEKRLAGVPRRRFFKIYTDELIELLKSEIATAKSSKLYCETTHTNTENTSKNTSRDSVFTIRTRTEIKKSKKEQQRKGEMRSIGDILNNGP